GPPPRLAKGSGYAQPRARAVQGQGRDQPRRSPDLLSVLRRRRDRRHRVRAGRARGSARGSPRACGSRAHDGGRGSARGARSPRGQRRDGIPWRADRQGSASARREEDRSDRRGEEVRQAGREVRREEGGREEGRREEGRREEDRREENGREENGREEG